MEHHIFSTHGPDKGTQQAIASCFWSLLLSEPAQVEPFVDMAYHEGYFLMGLEGGAFFVEEFGDYGWENDRAELFDYLLPNFTDYPCPDCDGTGIDDFFPYTEDCPTCGGDGTVSWWYQE